METIAIFVVSHTNIQARIAQFAAKFSPSDAQRINKAFNDIAVSGLNVLTVQYKYSRDESGARTLLSSSWEFKC